MSAVLVLLIQFSVTSIVTCSCLQYENQLEMCYGYNETCPPWVNDENPCQCSPTEIFDGLVQCKECTLNASMPFCYCMSYNPKVNRTVVGYCVIRCMIQLRSPTRDHTVSKRYNIGRDIFRNATTVTAINNAYCADLNMNRGGQLCGTCQEGYTPPVYSYDMACVKCQDYEYNWLKYIAVAYVPLTLFYIIVVAFRITLMDGSTNGYIMTGQLITSPAMIRLLMVTVITNTSNTHATRAITTAMLTLYGIWNLDFFRLLYSPFCLDPKMTILETLLLDYGIALYPMVLVVITYLLVELHDRSPAVAHFWRPFYRCFLHLKKEWNIKSSVIGAFATFILLSYVKILNVSLDLLATVSLIDMKGEIVKPLYLGIDQTIQFFGRKHLPFALVALFMLGLCILPLMLLLLYPCRCFHKFLNRFQLHSHTIHTFIDIFQGSFRTHPRDCRYFATFYLVLRYVIVFLMNVFTYFFFPIGATVTTIAILLLAVTKPHKSQVHNTMDLFVFSWLTIVLCAFPFGDILGQQHVKLYHSIFSIVFVCIVALHPLYGVGLLISKIGSTKLICGVFSKCRKCCKIHSQRDLTDSVSYLIEYNENLPLNVSIKESIPVK